MTTEGPSRPGWRTREELALARAAVDEAARRVASIDLEHMSLGEITGLIRRAWGELDTAVIAAELIVQGEPLADAFPNGDEAPVLPTPRQLIYLAQLERQETHPRRMCAATTADGAPCRNTARDGLDTCGTHRRRPVTGRERQW